MTPKKRIGTLGGTGQSSEGGEWPARGLPCRRRDLPGTECRLGRADRRRRERERESGKTHEDDTVTAHEQHFTVSLDRLATAQHTRCQSRRQRRIRHTGTRDDGP